MKSNSKLYIAAGVIGLGIVGLWLSTSLGQGRRRYEVETQLYGTPEYRTDAARAIDAYERLMERYMDLTEQNLFNVSAGLATVAAKLDVLDAGLTKLDTRLARIERHLGIAPAPPAPVVPDPNGPRTPPARTPPPSRLR